MNKLPTWTLFFGLLLFVGCDSKTQTQPVQTAVATSTEDLPIVERAEYVNWSRFPVGTIIKHVRETTSEVDKVVVTTTSRLLSKSAEKVVIETQATVDRGGEPVVNPTMELEYAASFRLPPNMDASKFALPDHNAKAIGEESVQFNGKDYPAVVYEWTGSSEAGPTKNKMWFSDEIPGRVFRHEMTCSAFNTFQKVSEIEIPQS